MRISALCALTVIAGCGRLDFADVRVGPQVDAELPAVDGAGDAAPPDAFVQANRAFVTSANVLGTFGGLAGADAICANAATAAHLDGTFVAWLSTSTVNAKDRLSGSSGWVRTDGAPFAADVPSMLTGKLYNPLDLDENGAAVNVTTDLVWTGTDMNGGGVTGDMCDDWTAGVGIVVYVGAGGSEFTGSGLEHNCGVFSHHLYCFETGHNAVVHPSGSTGRIAFVSAAAALNGLPGLDAQCASDAAAAAIPGTFVAAVPTETATLESRFPTDAKPWRRVDGTIISATSTSLFDGTQLLSFLNQQANGVYVFAPTVMIGAAPTTTGTINSTCGNWTLVNGTPELASVAHVDSAYFWGGGGGACNTAPLPPVFCLQEN